MVGDDLADRGPQRVADGVSAEVVDAPANGVAAGVAGQRVQPVRSSSSLNV